MSDDQWKRIDKIYFAIQIVFPCIVFGFIIYRTITLNF